MVRQTWYYHGKSPKIQYYQGTYLKHSGINIVYLQKTWYCYGPFSKNKTKHDIAIENVRGNGKNILSKYTTLWYYHGYCLKNMVLPWCHIQSTLYYVQKHDVSKNMVLLWYSQYYYYFFYFFLPQNLSKKIPPYIYKNMVLPWYIVKIKNTILPHLKILMLSEKKYIY